MLGICTILYSACNFNLDFDSDIDDINKPSAGTDNTDKEEDDSKMECNRPDDIMGTIRSEGSYARVTIELRKKNADGSFSQIPEYRFSRRVDLNSLSAVDLPKGIAPDTYQLLGWADCFSSDKEEQPFYDIENLKGVSFDKDAYSGSDLEDRTAYYACQEVNIDGKTAFEVDLKIPHGGYKVILQNPGAILREGEKYTVVTRYNQYFPSSINLATERVNDSISGLSHTTTISGVTEQTNELCICKDLILCGKTSTSVLLEFFINDKDGMPVMDPILINIGISQGEISEYKIPLG